MLPVMAIAFERGREESCDSVGGMRVYPTLLDATDPEGGRVGPMGEPSGLWQQFRLGNRDGDMVRNTS